MKIRQKSYEKMMLMMMVLKETVMGCNNKKGSSAATSPAILRNSEWGVLFRWRVRIAVDIRPATVASSGVGVLSHYVSPTTPGGRISLSLSLSVSKQLLWRGLFRFSYSLWAWRGTIIFKTYMFLKPASRWRSSKGRLRTMSLLPHSVMDDDQEGLGFRV